MGFLVALITWINVVTNAIFGFFFAPISFVPGWLSITVISAVMGVLLLYLFKFTSNQDAIGRVRDRINANLLAVRLFKDSILVAFKSQGSVFLASFQLLYFAIVPMLVMIVPVSLIIAQMSLWYQFRPVDLADDPVVIKLKLNDELKKLPQVELKPHSAVKSIVGPVRVFSKKEVYWKITPIKEGIHSLVFNVGNKQATKQLAIGKGFVRVSPLRPGADFFDVFLYPFEKPFASNSIVNSISIDYPERVSWINGTDWWIIYFFIVSMIFAFAFKPLIKVRI